MPSVSLTTYKDLIDHLQDYAGAADSSREAARSARRAVQQAYRDFANGHRWSYYYQRGRLNLVGQQTAGTVAYDHTGGTYERMLTLADSTWPSWAALGTVRVGFATYEVAERKSSTVVTLTQASNPEDDLAAGTAYTLYRDTYNLPCDFLAMDQLVLVGNSRLVTYERPGEWLDRQRLAAGPATPSAYTIRGDPNYFGTMALSFFPAPDNAYQVDFMYQRRPRPLLLDEYKAGAASVAASGTSVSGSGTAWTAGLIGSVISFSANATDAATGLSGTNPYLFQRTVVDVASATALTIDAAAPQTVSAVKYSLSDPVDVEEGAMLTALLRECEKWLRIGKRMKAQPEEAKEYQDAMTRAWEQDSRSFAPRASGVSGPYRQRLANMPRGPDVS